MVVTHFVDKFRLGMRNARLSPVNNGPVTLVSRLASPRRLVRYAVVVHTTLSCIAVAVCLGLAGPDVAPGLRLCLR